MTDTFVETSRDLAPLTRDPLATDPLATDPLARDPASTGAGPVALWAREAREALTAIGETAHLSPADRCALAALRESIGGLLEQPAMAEPAGTDAPADAPAAGPDAAPAAAAADEVARMAGTEVDDLDEAFARFMAGDHDDSQHWLLGLSRRERRERRAAANPLRRLFARATR